MVDIGAMRYDDDCRGDEKSVHHEDGELDSVAVGVGVAGLGRVLPGHEALLRLSVSRLGAVHLQLPTARTHAQTPHISPTKVLIKRDTC